MKTAPMMVMFLPRFRWFIWGFGLCAGVCNVIDGNLAVPAFIGPVEMLCLGAITYLAEFANRRLLDQLAEKERVK